VEVHTAGRTWLVRETLSGFAAQLDPAEFLRVHRSHVVRADFIQEISPLFHGDCELVLRNGQRVGLSRRYKALLPAAIRERL
jgi:two-component system, LytTR family, response regulator